MPEKWYYAKNGHRFGAFTFVQLQQIAIAGLLTPIDMVMNSATKQWSSASSIRGLFATFIVQHDPGPNSFTNLQSGLQVKPSATSDNWYLAKNRVKHGPFSYEQLRQMAASGMISGSNMVLNDGATYWVSAIDVPGLVFKEPLVMPAGVAQLTHEQSNPRSEHPSKSRLREMSIPGRIWLSFWTLLAATTLILYFAFPRLLTGKLDMNILAGPPGEQRLLPRLENIPAVVLFLLWCIGGITWVLWFRARLRLETLQRVCAQLGLTLLPTPEKEDRDMLQAFPLFRVGENQIALNLATGFFTEHKITVLDYSFDIALDLFGTKQVFGQTVVIFFNVAKEAPNFRLLHRECWWWYNKSKRKGEAGDLSIGARTHRKFANTYQVDSENTSMTRDFFNARLMSFFVANPGWDVEVAGGNVLIYKERKTVKPQLLPDFIKESAKVVRALQEGEVGLYE